MWQVLGGYFWERKDAVEPYWDKFCRDEHINSTIILLKLSLPQHMYSKRTWKASMWSIPAAEALTQFLSFSQQIWPLLRDAAAVAEHCHDRHHAHHAEPVHQRPHGHWTQHQKALLHRSETLCGGLFTVQIKLTCISTMWKSVCLLFKCSFKC